MENQTQEEVNPIPDIKRSRYSIGKFLRKKKGLRKKDPKAIKVKPSQTLNEYFDFLVDNGAKINKLELGEFELKNGLKYTGLLATEKIISDEIIVSIPRKLILKTKDAYFSEIRKVYSENPEFFSPYHTKSWEDHMLLVFLLFEHSKGEKSNWYHLIKNLPRDIDYVIYWDETELKLLEDENLVRMAKKQRKEYDDEEAYVLGLPSKYPDLLDSKAFTPENIRWINTHLVTRCFGKFFEYVSMVPYAELFNHECSDVYYDLEYYENNPDRPKDYSMDPPEELTEDQMEVMLTSEGSYNSQDEEWDSDFEYDKDVDKKKAGIDQMLNSVDKKSKGEFAGEVSNRVASLENSLMNEINWADGFSIFFVKELLKEAHTMLENFNKNKVTINSARLTLNDLESYISYYKIQLRCFYLDVHDLKEDDITIKQKENAFRLNDSEPEKQPAIPFDADETWKDDKFDNFVMKTSFKDQFDPGSQVFFCYGRLSNRMMLLRYGVTIEYNKYEHMHLKVPYFKLLKGQDWLLEKLKDFKMSRYMRFKLKRTCCNIDLINFCKGSIFNLKKHGYKSLVKPENLDLELHGVEGACDILEAELEKFSKTPEENKKILQDPKTGYHEYFAAIYRLERQRLLTFHLRVYEVLLEILKRLIKKVSFSKAIERVEELEDEEEYNRNRVFLNKYIVRLLSSQFKASQEAQKKEQQE